MLPTVPRATTANWLEPSMLLPMYAMLSSSGLRAIQAGCQLAWVAGQMALSCWEIPAASAGRGSLPMVGGSLRWP
ncbi:hypothetical protein [Streptomyces sp. NPDC005877]|uniref:hypothetical protein n=1 Tax=Streptomyces sp. NPDC005877 TaxID=3155346 RepID=UPI0033FA45D3